MSEGITVESMRKMLTTEVRGAGCQRRYPEHVRAALGAYVSQRRASGVSARAVAKELGVGEQVLRHRERSHGHEESEWVAISVAETKKTSISEIVVYGPKGLRIEGIGIAALSDLIRHLG